jgi:hypothetical protein
LAVAFILGFRHIWDGHLNHDSVQIENIKPSGTALSGQPEAAIPEAEVIKEEFDVLPFSVRCGSSVRLVDIVEPRFGLPEKRKRSESVAHVLSDKPVRFIRIQKIFMEGQRRPTGDNSDNRSAELEIIGLIRHRKFIPADDEIGELDSVASTVDSQLLFELGLEDRWRHAALII